jgi:glycerate 2-kinase
VASNLIRESSLTDTTAARWRAHAARVFGAAVAAADPTQLVANRLARHGTEVRVEGGAASAVRWHAPTVVVGAGKAAARMAAGCERVLGAVHVQGMVIVADGCGVDLASIVVSQAGHPLPDIRGQRATRRLMELVTRTEAGGILCLISGGASSLLVRPTPPVSLQQKIATTQLLLECGADITELNTVRKHLSAVKGGGLLRQARVPMTALIISDVIGDDPGTIGSGPTAADATTFADAWEVVQRYGLTNRVPRTVADLLKNGADGRGAETVKPEDPEAGRCRNLIIGSNRIALDGAAQAARTLGWRVHIIADPVSGDTTEAARRFAVHVHEVSRSHPGSGPLCVLAGGETTVRVRGKGRGGRNQEFALALVDQIAGEELVVLSAGTDGIDGLTPAAGAFVDGLTFHRAMARRLSPAAALADNDSHTFFSQLGDTFECGPTGTNVMDIKIAMAPGVPRAPA